MNFGQKKTGTSAKREPKKSRLEVGREQERTAAEIAAIVERMAYKAAVQKLKEVSTKERVAIALLVATTVSNQHLGALMRAAVEDSGG